MEAYRLDDVDDLLEQDRGSSTRLSQSSLPLHQRSIGRQRDPWPSLLGQRNSEMSHVFSSVDEGRAASTVDDDTSATRIKTSKTRPSCCCCSNLDDAITFSSFVSAVSKNNFFKKKIKL